MCNFCNNPRCVDRDQHQYAITDVFHDNTTIFNFSSMQSSVVKACLMGRLALDIYEAMPLAPLLRLHFNNTYMIESTFFLSNMETYSCLTPLCMFYR